jgi:hypothetical protein
MESMKAQSRRARIAKLEQQAAVEEAKAGKTLRRSKPHVRKASSLRKQAERLREKELEEPAVPKPEPEVKSTWRAS